MIQRIQTIFLVLAVISGVLLFFFPLADYYNEFSGNFRFYITELRPMDPDPKITTTIWFTSPLWLISGVSVALSLVSVFLYKKRLVQLQLVAFNILLNIGLVVLIFLIYTSKITTLTNIEPSYQFGIFLPLITIVFLVVANRFIRKDEALVKAADRLR